MIVDIGNAGNSVAVTSFICGGFIVTGWKSVIVKAVLVAKVLTASLSVRVREDIVEVLLEIIILLLVSQLDWIRICAVVCGMEQDSREFSILVWIVWDLSGSLCVPISTTSIRSVQGSVPFCVVHVW